MTPDLNNLVGSAALCLVQAVIAVLGSLQQVGVPKLAGLPRRGRTVGSFAR